MSLIEQVIVAFLAYRNERARLALELQALGVDYSVGWGETNTSLRIRVLHAMRGV